jgi:hypothetical protein
VFSFENYPNIEAVPSASIFSSEIARTYGIMTAPRHIQSEEGRMLLECFHNGISEFLWLFIKYKIMFYSYVLNFRAEILPILTNNPLPVNYGLFMTKVQRNEDYYSFSLSLRILC